MADNVTFTVAADATPPGGTKAATDELADGSHAGIAKLAVSADGDRTLIPATAADGLLVEVSNPGAGGLTDAELRASPVDVDGSGVTQPVSNAGLTALNGAIAGSEVQVDLVGSVPAGNNNIGDVDVASVPAPLSTTGGGTEAAALRVTIANNSTGLVSVDDNGGSLTVDGPLTDAELRATPVPVSGTLSVNEPVSVDDNGGSLTVDGTVTANAGTNLNTSALAVESGGNLAAAAASLSVLDDWDETDRAKVNPIAGQAGVQGGSGTVNALTQRVVLATDVALPAGTNAIGKLAANSGVDIGDVDVTSLPALPAGTNNIGDVDVLSLPAIPAGTNNIGDVDVLTMPVTEVVGDVAADAAVPANPVAVGGRASTALPSPVSADGDSVYAWLNRNGAQIVALAPHTGLNSDPYNLLHEAAQYTGTQTSTVLIAGGASEKIVVTKVQIQAGGTTAGTLQLYFGTGAFSRGTSRAIFDGEFAPSATLKPGVIMDGPFIAGTNGDDLLVTTSAAINPLTVNVWYYIVL